MKKLHFTNGKFKIMLVGDPHEHTVDNDKEEEKKYSDYLALQYAAVEAEKPDLVILMGDNATGKTRKDIKRTLLRSTKPYAEAEIPFSFVLGNHDLECDVDDREEQYDIYRELPCCILPEKKDVTKFGDYTVPIFKENTNEPALVIRHFYSGNRADECYDSYYAFIGGDQLAEYESDAAALKEKYGKTIPAIAIQHIPVPEIFELLNERGPLSMILDGVCGQNGNKGKFYTLNRKAGATGYMGEAPCPPDHNGGEFDSWLKTGDVFAAFFGHDHMNDFTGMVRGIIIGMVKTASFHAYGDGLMQGVRIIELNERDIRNINTYMVRYRDLIGSDCLSLHGSIKNLRDRTSVKLEFTAKCAAVAAGLLSPVIISKLIKGMRKHK